MTQIKTTMKNHFKGQLPGLGFQSDLFTGHLPGLGFRSDLFKWHLSGLNFQKRKKYVSQDQIRGRTLMFAKKKFQEMKNKEGKERKW